MKYFVVVLLGLAVYVEVSDADCLPFVTVSQNFTKFCEDIPIKTTVKLPDPTNNMQYVSCANSKVLHTPECSPDCFNVKRGYCGNAALEVPICVDSTKICGPEDKRVPYAPRTIRFNSKYFADCNTASLILEVGICYSNNNEYCLFDSKQGQCVVDDS